MKPETNAPPEKQQVVYLAVYDMQGGPVPPALERYVSTVAATIAEKFPGLAISTSVE